MLRQLIDFLFANPILLILLLGWVGSMATGVMTRAARRAAEAQREAQREAQGRAQGQDGRGGAQPQPRRVSPQRSPEDVAAEIRQMMGLEPAPRVREVEPVTEPPDEPVPVPEPEPEHGGDLVARLERMERERRARFDDRLDARSKELDDRAAASRFRALPEHQSQLAPDAPTVGRSRRRRAAKSTGGGRLFDATDPRRAIVALEVLGPPRALRRWE